MLPRSTSVHQRIDLAQRVESRRRRLTVAVLGTISAVIVGLGVLIAVTHDASSTTPRSASAERAASATTTRSQGSGSTGSASATTRLQEQRASDREALAGVEGYWLPQTSSKREGSTMDGVVWSAQRIWTEFQTTQSQHPEARLAWSGDWGSFRQGGYWVTVIDTRSATPAEANAWCDAQGFATDQC